jgi:hypothetical protein
VEGNLKANAGSISFTAEHGSVRIDYRAAIDIGLPESWTLAYKKKFVKEFMTSAFEKARTLDAEPTLVLAAGQ